MNCPQCRLKKKLGIDLHDNCKNLTKKELLLYTIFSKNQQLIKKFKSFLTKTGGSIWAIKNIRNKLIMTFLYHTFNGSGIIKIIPNNEILDYRKKIIAISETKKWFGEPYEIMIAPNYMVKSPYVLTITVTNRYMLTKIEELIPYMKDGKLTFRDYNPKKDDNPSLPDNVITLYSDFNTSRAPDITLVNFEI